MAPNEVEPGDRARCMRPTRVPGGFVVCAPAQAYWTALDGRRVLVPLLGEVDKVVE